MSMTISGDDPNAPLDGPPCENQMSLTADTAPNHKEALREASREASREALGGAASKSKRQRAKDIWAGIKTSPFYRRLISVFGEVTSVVLGVTFIWLWLLNQVLANDETDISFLKPNLSAFFAQAFEGQSGDIGSVKLYWSPIRNKVGVGLKNVSIFDDETEIQHVDSLSAWFDLNDLAALTVKAEEIDIVGGEITWLRRKDGSGLLGLGTPDTVGRFGIIYASNTHRKTPNLGREDNRLIGLRSASITQAKVHIRDEVSDFSAILAPANLTLSRSGERMELDLDLASGPLSAKDGGEGDGQISLHAEFSQGENLGQGAITATRLRPDKLAPNKGRFKSLSGVQLPVDIVGGFTFNRHEITRADMKIDVGKGQIDLLGLQSQVTSGRFDVKFEGVSAPIDIRRYALISEKFSGQGKGQFTWASPQKRGGDNYLKFNVLSDDVKADLTPFLDMPLLVEQLELSGDWTPKTRKLSILDLKFNQPSYNLVGAVDLALDDKSGLVQLSGNLENEGMLPIEEFLKLWPIGLAPKTRQWLVNAFKSGRVSRLSGSFDFSPERFELASLPPEALSVDMAIEDAQIKFMPDMPQISGAQGTGRINGSEMTFSLSQGQLNNLSLSNGRIYFPNFRAPDSRLFVETLARGQISDMLEIAEREPIALTRRYGMPVQPTSGQGIVTIKLDRPLGHIPRKGEIRYRLEGDFTDVATPLPGNRFDLHLSEGRAILALDNSGISVSGPAKINGWDVDVGAEKSFTMAELPAHYTLKGRFGRDILDSLGIGLRQYVGGSMDISADMFGTGMKIDDAHIIANLSDTELSLSEYYNKIPGQAALLSFSLHNEASGVVRADSLELIAPGISLTGEFALQNNLQFDYLKLDQIKIADLLDGNADIRPNSARDRFVVNFNGPSFNLANFLKGRLDGQSGGAKIPADIYANADRLRLSEAYEVAQAKLDYHYGPLGFEYGSLQGGRPNGNFLFKISMADPGRPRSVLFEVPDVDILSQSVMQQTSFTGGTLLLNGELPPIGKNGPLIGDMKMRGFTLTRAPALAQMLSLASLKGITDIFAGSGLYFELLDVPFSYESSALEFREARMNGPALGMTGNGNIDFGLKMMDMDGVLVPSYTANSLLGDIPVLGEVLVGKKGEGVFALNYTIKGPFETTQVTINPLSALTPGFLRRIFDAPRKKIKKSTQAIENE